jgi:hypothetical protein
LPLCPELLPRLGHFPMGELGADVDNVGVDWSPRSALVTEAQRCISTLARLGIFATGHDQGGAAYQMVQGHKTRSGVCGRTRKPAREPGDPRGWLLFRLYAFRSAGGAPAQEFPPWGIVDTPCVGRKSWRSTNHDADPQ